MVTLQTHFLRLDSRKLFLRSQSSPIIFGSNAQRLRPGAKLFGFQEDDHCVCARTRYPFTGALPNIERFTKGVEAVGETFSSVSSRLGGSKQGEKGKLDTAPRAKMVQSRSYWTSPTRHNGFAVARQGNYG